MSEVVSCERDTSDRARKDGRNAYQLSPNRLDPERNCERTYERRALALAPALSPLRRLPTVRRAP